MSRKDQQAQEVREEKRRARRNRKKLCIGIFCSLVIGFAIGLNWDKIKPKVEEYSSKAFEKGKEALEEKKIAAKVDELRDSVEKLLSMLGK